MSSIKFYSDHILKLTTRLTEVEDENIELRLQLSRCESKLEILQIFYSDFKHIVGAERNLSDDIILSEKKEYSTVLSEYLITQNSQQIIELFENYDVLPSQIFTDIRNKLPDNIKVIAKRFKCLKELSIIEKSITNIKKFNKGDSTNEKGITDLVSNYIDAYNKNKKTSALKYLKQVLVYFPFQFPMFLDNINQYYYEGLDEHITKLKLELYDENNMLLSEDELLSLLSIEPTKIITKKEKVRKKGTHTDYKNTSVEDLVKLVINIKSNPRQKAKNIFTGMESAKRSDEDCMKYVGEVNKILNKKI